MCKMFVNDLVVTRVLVSISIAVISSVKQYFNDRPMFLFKNPGPQVPTPRQVRTSSTDTKQRWRSV